MNQRKTEGWPCWQVMWRKETILVLHPTLLTLSSIFKNLTYKDFPCSPPVKNLPAKAGDMKFDFWSGRMDATCHGTTKLTCATTEVCAPWSPCSVTRGATAKWESHTLQLVSEPCSLQLEKDCEQQQIPSAVKKKKKKEKPTLQNGYCITSLVSDLYYL